MPYKPIHFAILAICFIALFYGAQGLQQNVPAPVVDFGSISFDIDRDGVMSQPDLVDYLKSQGVGLDVAGEPELKLTMKSSRDAKKEVFIMMAEWGSQTPPSFVLKSIPIPVDTPGHIATAAKMGCIYALIKELIEMRKVGTREKGGGGRAVDRRFLITVF